MKESYHFGVDTKAQLHTETRDTKSENDCEIFLRDDGVYILQTEDYRFHLDEKTHVEKIGRLINENEQLKLLIAFIKQMKKCDCKSCPVDEYIQKLIE